jgi:L-ascorbate metabolism protein UlaG (beta-lactamase superfamily)
MIDPYSPGSVPGLRLPKLSADAVFCSHEHADHNATDEVELRTSGPANPYTVETILTDHDDQGGTLRGKNRVLILKSDRETVIHLGDLGCIPGTDVLSRLTHADILMIPCGGYYTIDAAQAEQLIRILEPKLAVLMHYRRGKQGYDVLASAEDVCRVIPEARMLGKSFVTPDQETGVILLDPIPEALLD